MRRFIALIFCCILFCTTAYADNAASEVRSTGSVAQNGSCQIALTATVRLDEAVNDVLLFPLGTEVSAVSLNGTTASLDKTNGITSVKLKHLKNQTGTFPFSIHYTIHSVVSTDEDGNQTITIPLLYGFRLPIESMSFSVTMPGTFDAVPAFYSGYHDQDIERSISYNKVGATISGTVTTVLKDSETLFLTLQAPEGMFPQNQASGGSLVFDGIAMGVCAALALAYWFATMRCLPSFPIRRSTPPEGLTAGNLGCYLVHKTADLTMMVVTWAQLGYLLIHLDEHGRVILHKKMDMGNERNSFEQRCFKTLFGKGLLIDGTSYRYARLCEKTAAMSRRYAAGFRHESGNPLLFRFLACGVGLFAGVAMGDSMTTSPAWRVILMIFLSVVCAIGSWYIQGGMDCLHLKDKLDLYISLACCAGFLILGASCDCIPHALICIGWNLFVGLAAAYGGRRSENGKRVYADILGLRRYMKNVSKSELIRILRSNPDYYYELAPYAIALGVDRKFAKRFAQIRQPACTWLVTGMDGARTATEWYPLLREAVNAMNNLQKRPPWEKFLNFR